MPLRPEAQFAKDRFLKLKELSVVARLSMKHHISLPNWLLFAFTYMCNISIKLKTEYHTNIGLKFHLSVFCHFASLKMFEFAGNCVEVRRI